MNNVIIRFTICLFLFLPSCDKDSNYGESLTLPKIPYTGSNLKLDGYYYRELVSDNAQQIYFLYKNGVVLGGDLVFISELPNRLVQFTNGEYYNSAKDDAAEWGVFGIKGSQIEIEKWYPSSGGHSPVYINSGTILNDSTFQITSYAASHGPKNLVMVDEKYLFKKFSPKPDSTNKFTH